MSVESFAGFEPQVGEIRAVRTFRIGVGGVLFPLFSSVAWVPGENVARCGLPHQPVDGDSHIAPDPDCTCGFYAYADEHAASEYAHATHVLAVVSCWGRVIAGTRGIRAERARIEAIWMSDTVPADLAAQVAQRYPATSVYTDRAAMLVQHAPSALDCYELDTPRARSARRLGTWFAVAVAIVLGAFPRNSITGNHDILALWVASVASFVSSSVVLGRRRTDIGAHRRALACAALVLWLLAPFAGAAGLLLLRLPLMQMTALAFVQRGMLRRAATQFPAPIG